MSLCRKTLKNIDPLIRGLVFFLNEKEISTTFSCEGHAPNHEMYITFNDTFFLANKEKLEIVAKEFNQDREYTFQTCKVQAVFKRIAFCLLGSEHEKKEEIKKIENIFKEVFNGRRKLSKVCKETSHR